MAPHRTTPRTRAGLLAGAAAIAALAFPGIANAAVNSAVNGTALTVSSTADDPITITSDAQGRVKVNTADPGTGEFDADLLTSITVTGGPGANTIDLSGVSANAFPKVTAVTATGAAGNDTITGSQLADRLIGGDNDDDVSGLAGNDTIVWNPGDDTDRNEGGDGRDAIEVNGGGVGETFTLDPSATAPRLLFERTPPTPNPPGNFALDIGTSEQLDLNMNGGDDTFTSNGAIAALGFDVDVDGGDGNDSIDGSDGADVLTGGNGDDRIVPDDNPANTRDVAHGDAGNDLIVWNGGDDDDLNDGGDGTDTSQVNGAAANETFTVKPGPNGHVIFDRTAPTPTPVPGFFNIDISTTETLDLNMNGGDDTVTGDPGFASLALDVDGGDGNDRIDGSDAADTLSGGNGDDTIVPDDNPAGTTDVAHGDAGNDTTIWNPGDDDDLNEGGDGDDTSVVNGGGGDEDFTVKPSATAGRVRLDRVNPAPFFVDIGTTEHLQLNAGGGDDTLKGDAGLAGLIKSELNGDDGNDLVRGTDGEDRLNGGAGHDLIRSRDRAEDLVDCGTGFDLAKVDRRDFVRGCNIIIGGHLKVRVAHKTLHADHNLAALRLKCVGTKRCKGTVRLRHHGRSLATKKFNITKRSTTVHLKLNRRGLRLMADAPAKGRKVKVQIDASDARGNGWRSAARLTLKP